MKHQMLKIKKAALPTAFFQKNGFINLIIPS